MDTIIKMFENLQSLSRWIVLTHPLTQPDTIQACLYSVEITGQITDLRYSTRGLHVPIMKLHPNAINAHT